jgi:hypothetical protein
MQMHMRRFTRLTNASSEKVENHAAAIALHTMCYEMHPTRTVSVMTLDSLKYQPTIAPIRIPGPVAPATMIQSMFRPYQRQDLSTTINYQGHFSN